MKNTFNLKDINMHIVLVAKIYNYDITITYTNNYNMHFFENLGIKRSIDWYEKFFCNHYWKNKMLWFYHGEYT